MNHSGLQDLIQELNLLPFEPTYDNIIHKIPTKKSPNKKDGWYLAFSNSKIVIMQNYQILDGKRKYLPKGSKGLSQKEIDHINRETERLKKQEEQKRLEKIQKAIDLFEAGNRWETCRYLVDKKIDDLYGCKTIMGHGGRTLMVPLRDIEGQLKALQFIEPSGFKTYLGPKKGLFYMIGQVANRNPIIICEGVATGMSLHMATTFPVVCAMDTDGYEFTGKAIREKNPEAEIIIASDNDVTTEINGKKINPGVASANRLAKSIGAKIAVPEPIDGQNTDFNDVHMKLGIDAVRDYFEPPKKFRNFYLKQVEKVDKKNNVTMVWKPFAYSAREVFDNIRKIISGKFYTIGPHLIYKYKKNDKFNICSKIDSFFATIIDQNVIIEWKEGEKFLKKSEFFHYCRYNFPPKENIYSTPQYPKIKNVIYCYSPPIEEKTGYIDRLINFWNPSTEFDRVLMKAAILTPGWGGLPGKRPAFIVEGDKKDNGRGIGKTEFVDTVIDLHGEKSVHISFNNKVDFDAVKTRILSGGKVKRLIRIDNVKADSIDSAELEDFITLKEISGRQLYEGEGSVANYFTVFFTLNEGELSSDMSQRVIRIKLSRPQYRKDWVKDLSEFIEQNRRHIISEIISTLKSSVKKQPQKVSRFSYWQEQVLGKIDTQLNLDAVIAERQNEVNKDIADSHEFIEYIRLRITDGGFHDEMGGAFNTNPSDSDLRDYLITPTLLANWYRDWPDCPSRKISNKKALDIIKNMGLKELSIKDKLLDGRKFWRFAKKLSSEEIKIQGLKNYQGAWIIHSQSKKRLKFTSGVK